MRIKSRLATERAYVNTGQDLPGVCPGLRVDPDRTAEASAAATARDNRDKLQTHIVVKE
jgi:hypothetical protein